MVTLILVLVGGYLGAALMHWWDNKDFENIKISNDRYKQQYLKERERAQRNFFEAFEQRTLLRNMWNWMDDKNYDDFYWGFQVGEENWEKFKQWSEKNCK